MDREILDTIREKGLLLEKEVFDLIDGFGNKEIAKDFLEQLERVSGQKMLTKSVLSKNVAYVKEFVEKLPGQEKVLVKKVCVNLGLSFEVRDEKENEVMEGSGVNASAQLATTLEDEVKVPTHPPEAVETVNEDAHREMLGAPREALAYKLFYADTKPDKKLEVKDFTYHFRSRFQQLQRILMSRPELNNNLVSINKIGSERTSLSIIGIVKEKRVTKNKNLIISFEDLTGEIGVLFKFDKQELFEKASELQLDDVVGVKASGSNDFLFGHDIFFPDSFKLEKMKFDEDFSVAFISDIHCGSDRHLEKSFGNFLEWINSDDEAAKKIKYLFIVGDNVDGVGVFPGQENVLKLKSIGEQYEVLASYLSKIPKHITMFMCPGQHDASRVAEPQTIISKKYAPQLYEIENLVLVTNPTLVKLSEGESENSKNSLHALGSNESSHKEFKIYMYHGASIHSLINEIKELREMKAHMCPAKAIEHMLKRRHVAPTHSEAVYIPNAEKDPLVISEVPDIFCTGEVHRLDVSAYHGTLIITGSCWQAQTSFEERIGNVPIPCKVPVFNLKTRELKIFDFRDDEEVDENGVFRGEAGDS